MAKNEKKTRMVSLEAPYGRTITLRKSGVSKAAWEYIVHKFGVTSYEPDKILSITVDGEDDFGHLLVSIMVEE